MHVWFRNCCLCPRQNIMLFHTDTYMQWITIGPPFGDARDIFSTALTNAQNADVEMGTTVWLFQLVYCRWGIVIAVVFWNIRLIKSNTTKEVFTIYNTWMSLLFDCSVYFTFLLFKPINCRCGIVFSVIF